MPPSRVEALLPLKVQWGAHTSLAFAAPQKQPAGASTFFWHYKQQKCLFTVLRYDPSSPSWNYPERAGTGERAAPGSCFRLQVAGNTRTCSRPRTVGATSTSSHQQNQSWLVPGEKHSRQVWELLDLLLGRSRSRSSLHQARDNTRQCPARPIVRCWASRSQKMDWNQKHKLGTEVTQIFWQPTKENFHRWRQSINLTDIFK